MKELASSSGVMVLDQPTVDAENPWPGLAAFREAEQAFFRGRDSEAEALLCRVRRARLTVVFGRSRLGKTSLLQAGLFPRVRKENVLPVYIRLDYSEDRAPLTKQILTAIAREAKTEGVEIPAPTDSETLWEYFHRENADFCSKRNRPTTPLLVFDQFEEIFTLGHNTSEHAAATSTLIEELSDLVEGRPPLAVKARLEERPEEARGFSFNRHGYKVLLSLQEDFLPHLESLRDRMPSIAVNRLHLHRMRGDAALEVVRHARRLVTKEVARRLVLFVAAVKEPDKQSG